MGLTTGAASKKVVDSATLNPPINSPRATGMFPHSQTGMNAPNREITKRLGSGRLGSRRIRRCVVAKRRMPTETNAPKITKGKDSTTTLKVRVTKSCSLAGKERPKAPVVAVFNQSKSTATRPNPTKSTRKRASARLLSFADCAFCMLAV